jgi:hypothetical protein
MYGERSMERGITLLAVAARTIAATPVGKIPERGPTPDRASGTAHTSDSLHVAGHASWRSVARTYLFGIVRHD